MDMIDDPKRLALRSSEELYDQATRYGFARRFVKGKSVLDIHWGEVGRGPLVLCGAAESVEALSNSPEAVALASNAHPASNVSYLEATLPKLPYPDDGFEIVVAFGVMEKLDRPEELVREVRRVLKPGGLFVPATPDKQANSNERNLSDPENRGEMYVGELEETLGRHFGNVRLYRQGSVAGGAVYRDLGPTPFLESARPALSEPDFGAGPPKTRFVLAVCGDAGGVEAGVEEPYVLLDRDRTVFEECEDRAEDARLLREEARRMQETEVQTFQDALKLQRSEIAYLRALLDHSENQVQNLRTRHEDLKARHANLRSHYETRKTSQEKLHNRHQVLKEQHEGLQARNEALETRSEALEARSEALETRNEALETRSEALKDRLEKHKTHSAALQKRLRSIEDSGTWRLFEPYRRLRARLAGRKEAG
ncbi:MAG TPA: methyltransferase domain-containing protein [Rubrobacter sp.]|nr:methyltransferase domain-containing protein [Rubrobacter sp.]